MAGPLVLIFHRPSAADDAPLVRLLADTRLRSARSQAALFSRLGARVLIGEGSASSFGELLHVSAPAAGGLVVLGSGAVPRLSAGDARRLLAVARSGKRLALTNNRYSSDVCALGDAAVLRDLPALPSDNALPRWLEEVAGYRVEQLGGRERLALDIDSPLDVGLWACAPHAPAWVKQLATAEALIVPRAGELRELAADPRRELLVFGRAGSVTLHWLEGHVRCRVRFLAEERGLRASSPLALRFTQPAGSAHREAPRPPRATLGRLLAARGPQALADTVAELADGALIDTRVLLADRLGADEAGWPVPADRFASDLLRADQVGDGWLRTLTASATGSSLPIALGAHSLVGPGVRLLLGSRLATHDRRADEPRC